MLFGRNDDDKEAAYIGEAEEVYTRPQSHLREKDFWNEVIVFISKDENLNKAHIKYIESKLYEKAESTANKVLFINAARGAKARGTQPQEAFIIFAGFKIADSTVDSFSERLAAKRDDLILSNKIQIIEN